MDTNTTIKTVAKGDCFFSQGEECGTLYYIVEVVGEKCYALSICISENYINADDYACEYGLELPNDVIMLPSKVYDAIKAMILDCGKEINKLLRDEALDIDFELKVGALYTNGAFIYRFVEKRDDCWHYDLFYIDSETIANNWSGNISDDVAKNVLKPISISTYTRVQQRFEKLQQAIAQLIEQFSYRILNVNR